jgi:hypothetical protein
MRQLSGAYERLVMSAVWPFNSVSLVPSLVQTRTIVSSTIAAILRPSGLKIGLPSGRGSLSLVKTTSCLPDGISQTRKVLSLAFATRRCPSGLNEGLPTHCEWLDRTATVVPFSPSTMCTASPKATAAKCPSGLNVAPGGLERAVAGGGPKTRSS